MVTKYYKIQPTNLKLLKVSKSIFTKHVLINITSMIKACITLKIARCKGNYQNLHVSPRELLLRWWLSVFTLAWVNNGFLNSCMNIFFSKLYHQIFWEPGSASFGKVAIFINETWIKFSLKQVLSVYRYYVYTN